MQKVEAKGVTVAEWVVMREMLQTGPINPSQLAERLGMTRGAISKLVERLCRKKFVQRTAAGRDRRYQSVTLTSVGMALVPKLARLADDNDREFFSHLTTEQQHDLVRVLKDIVYRHGWKDAPVN
jgi:DNA-binding MarR family transcriptional regulator